MNEQTCVMSKFNKKELKNYKSTVSDALKVLGKKNFALIIHGASFPSVPEYNTGIGSPNSKGAQKLISFIDGVFNGLQLGPAGKTKAIDSSPYTGTIFSNNTLFINLQELTTDKWSNILSIETFNNIVRNNPNSDKSLVAYSYIFAEQEKALSEAFENFNKSGLKDLKARFEQFKKENNEWLEKDSLYEALIVKHSNDYWPLWQDETDKNLYNPKNEEQKKQAQQRIKELKAEYSQVIEYYAFCQFVAFAQKEDIKEFALSHDVKMIADRQVAFSDRDVWANQALFLEGWFLGCPPDYFSKDGQAWGFPVVDPNKLFAANGELLEGGKLLKALFKKMFKENPGGVRIDHIVGLIDPWVYKAGKLPKPEQGAGRLFSSPEHPELSKYAIATMDDLNLKLESDKEKRVKQLSPEQVKRYGALIEKIVIAAAEEEGLTKDAIVCEDLGTLTYPVEQVMKQYQLKGMRLTQFVVAEKPEHIYRCKNIDSAQWAMVGTHDNEPLVRWAKSMVNTHEGYLNAKNLAEDLLPTEKQSEVENFAAELSRNKELLLQTKFVELFACPAENLQIFFSDLFGIDDVYNRPGTSGDKNWSLRLPNNFEEFYFEQLSKGKGVNLPHILKLAIETKGQAFVDKNIELVKELDKLACQLRG